MAHRVCATSYPFPRSIAMTAFVQTSLFCASFGSSWCCFKSLHTLSIHLSLGLPQGLFPPRSSWLLPLQYSCRLFSWPYNEREEERWGIVRLIVTVTSVIITPTVIVFTECIDRVVAIHMDGGNTMVAHQSGNTRG